MYKNKKILAFTGSIIAATIPVAVVVSCGSASNELKIKDNEKTNIFKGGPSINSFQKDIDHLDNSDGKTWKEIEKQAAYFYYKKEQEGSLKVQKDKFLWELREKQDEKIALANIDKNKKAREDLQKDIDGINKKIKKIDDASIDYASNDFSSDFPEILLPEKEIRKKQEDIYTNEKKAFVDKYSTKEEGETAWITELSKKYDGANSKKEAIDNLVYKVIKTNAFLRNNIKIDTSFTVKQLKWANTTGANGGKDKDAFPFLQIDQYDGKSNVEDAIKKAVAANKDPSLRVTGDNTNDKVYFYGTDSKIWGHQNEDDLKLIDQAKLQEIIGTKSIYRMYRHALLNIRPNPKGRALPWEASIDEIKKLIALQPSQTDVKNNPKYQFQRITNLWKQGAPGAGIDMTKFDSKVDPQTAFFLQQVSDNSDSTKNIGGSLGIHKASYFSNAMFNGFALGALVIENRRQIMSLPGKNINDFLDQDDRIYKNLSDAIKRAKNEIFSLNSSSGPTKFTTNKQQNDFIDSLNQDQVKSIFGQEIRNLFDPRATSIVGQNGIEKGQIGRGLVYTDLPKTANARFAFISTEEKGGIHLVKSYVVDGSTLGQKAIKDLEKMANDEDINNSQYNLVELVKPLLSDSKLIRMLIEDTTKDEGKKFKSWVQTQIDDNNIKLSDFENIKNVDDLIKDAKDYIESESVLKANEVASQITKAHSDYLKKALDNQEIGYESGGNLNNKEILKPKDIYRIAYKMGEDENEI